MRFRIITSEKSKSCAIIAIGASLYLIESAYEESGASVIRGLGVFLATHAVVLLARCILVLRKAASDESIAKLLKFIVVATLLTGLFTVCCVYASGRAFDTDWRAYVNALVIGGLTAIFHLVPLEKFKRNSAAPGVPHKR